MSRAFQLFRAIPVVLVLLSGVADAEAPTGRLVLTVPTVADTVTGLTWQRVGPTGTYSRDGAAGYCSSLNLAGLTGWRLPTIRELETLVDVRTRGPAIDTTAFPDTANLMYWSSTGLAGLPAFGWLVMFTTGESYFSQLTSVYRVRCVRGS